MWKMAMVVAMVAVAHLVGCARPFRSPCEGDDGVYRWTAGADFDDEQLAHMKVSAARWDAFAGHHIAEISRGTDGACHITQEHEQLYSGDTAAFALSNEQQGYIKIGPAYACDGDEWGQDPACLERMVMHEMGHDLGMEHLPDAEDGIMRGTGGVARDWSQEDLYQCVARGICR